MPISLELAMLASLADAPAPTLREMPVSARRRYNRETVAKHRAEVSAMKEAGILRPTAPHVRDALADAALSILAVGGPGTEEIRKVLRSVFHAHVGTPMTVEVHARSGKLKPKFYKSS